ncbi:hypothetical protein B0H17DRAFT_1196733 [Mycena rosella]|uniref:Uncharacterized protein n=1 Tax=Mycena rosella TaxID=1033263 RepID=A0AAD7DSD7_MYCRO|nr:hypothetical protein B0H17DRAFT_1196733 [Mycena rosella]
MLQIPSSALSLISSSRVVFALGAYVAFSILLSGFSIPKDSFVATGTTELFLPPTKCVPSPGTIASPYLAAMAYTTIIFASLFCILRAKGFSSVGKQPPSPPPESNCSTDKIPRQKSWGWLIWLIAIILVLAGGVGVYTYFTGYDSRHVLTPWASSSRRNFSWIERCYLNGCAEAASYISAVKKYIFLHGRQHSKILLMALSTHSISFLVVFALRRLSNYCARQPLFIGLSLQLIVLIPTIASSPHLSWIFWCFMYRYGTPECLTKINWNVLRLSSYLSSVATSHFLELSTIIGITLIQLIWLLHPPCLLFLLYNCVFVIPCWAACSAVAFWLEINPGLTPEDQQTLRNSFSFTRRARRETRIVLWQLVWHYEDWKAAQLEEFHELTAGLPNTLLKAWCGIWSHLHPIHKLLIVAPAVIFYGYFYFFLAARRIPWLIEKWRRRWQVLPPHFLVQTLIRIPQIPPHPSFSPHRLG